MNRVVKAWRDGKLSTEEVRAQFEITDELKDFLKLHEVEL